VQRSDVGAVDVYGNTVLHVVAYSGHVDVCTEILQYTATDDNSSSSTTTASLIDVLNSDGCTPIDLAKSKPTPRYNYVTRNFFLFHDLL